MGIRIICTAGVYSINPELMVAFTGARPIIYVEAEVVISHLLGLYFCNSELVEEQIIFEPAQSAFLSPLSSSPLWLFTKTCMQDLILQTQPNSMTL